MDEAEELLTVSTRPSPGAVVVELVGELDLHTSPRLRSQVDELLASRVGAIHVDATGVRFADSSGLQALLVTRRAAAAHGVGFRMVGRSAALDRVLDITGLDQVLGTDGR
jgi:anti-sigma B factor antagonist